MSRTLFAAGRIDHQGFTVRQRPQLSCRSFACPVLECAEPDGVTVELHWDCGIGELGLLAGWHAGNVVTHCGCTLTARENEGLRMLAEDEANGHGD